MKVVPVLAKAAEWATSGVNIYNTNSGNVGIGTSNPAANLVALYKTAGNTDISFGNSLATFYALGVDHGDSDKFKISGSGALGTGDVFIIAKAASTLYTNIGGSGDRTSMITATYSPGLAARAASLMVDGATTALSGIQVPNGITDVTGAYIQFDFGVGVSKVISEVKWYLSNNGAQGTWKYQGSNDASAWTDIVSNGVFGFPDTLTNSTGYRYYRVLGVSGAIIGGGSGYYIDEVEFKIGDATGNQFVGIHNATPTAALSIKAWGSSTATAFEVLQTTGATSFTALDNGNIGIGTPMPNTKFQITGGDAAVTTQGNGMILRATDGANCYRVTVNNLGALATTAVTCP